MKNRIAIPYLYYAKTPEGEEGMIIACRNDILPEPLNTNGYWHTCIGSVSFLFTKGEWVSMLKDYNKKQPSNFKFYVVIGNLYHWDSEIAKEPFPKTDFKEDNIGFEIINPLEHEQTK